MSIKGRLKKMNKKKKKRKMTKSKMMRVVVVVKGKMLEYYPAVETNLCNFCECGGHSSQATTTWHFPATRFLS